MAQYTQRPKLSQLAVEVHQNAVQHGFWEETHSADHYLTLVVCELAEAVEADRAGNVCDRLMYDTLMEEWDKEAQQQDPEQYQYEFESYFKSFVKDTTGDELADAVIRLLDLAASYHVDFKHSKVEIQGMSSGWLFTENVWAIINTITSPKLELAERIVSGIMALETLALFAQVDLWWHVATKMTYNASRPYKHGKKY